MSSKAVEVNKLSKKYYIREGEPKYRLLRDDIGNFIKKPLKKRSKKKKTKEFWALRNVSFSVKKGEVLGIIGQNGAGKSTLLKILSRITKPTSGQAYLYGSTASLLEIGTGFNPELSGSENIYLNGALLGMKKKVIESKFDEIVEFSEIKKFLDTPVKYYSSGMYMRLAFAVASHLESEILMIDEVLSVGDMFFQKKSMGKMKAVAKSGRTIILVSHSMGSIRDLCHRVVLLDKGGVVDYGDTEKVINKYANITKKAREGPTVKYKLKPKLEGQHLSMTLVDKNKKPKTVFKTGEKAYALVNYKIRKTLQNSDVSVMISELEQPLWLGFDNDAKPKLLLKRVPGTYHQIVELPVHLLMPGHYHLGPSMGYVGKAPIDRHHYDGINFEVTEITINPNHRAQRKEKGGAIVYIKNWEDM